ncbi:MAG: hypothetical protein JWP32_168, partial [Schumannella sp.]|nr:hypothetical protein [Schumannella sp.]
VAAAVADPDDCTSSHYATGGRVLFEPEVRYIPVPLRAFPADCASRIEDEPFDDGAGISVAYYLLYTDITWEKFTRIVRSFESAGYGPSTGLITSIDEDPLNTVNETVSLTADDLAARDGSQVDFALARFSDPATGLDIFEVYYTDGDSYKIDQEINDPSLEITLFLAGPFGRSTTLAAPSVLSSLRAFTLPTATQTAVIATGAVALMLVVGWPSALLNSVVGSRYDGLVRSVQKRFRRRRLPPRSDGKDAKAPDPVHAVDHQQTAGGIPPSRLPGWLMWPGFALAAILGAFVDPDFGVNPMSGRVLVTLFLSFVLFNLATWAIVRRVARRIQPDSTPYLRFRWGSLLLVALAVGIARLLALEPGIIFGLVAGVAYATALRASKSAVLTLVGSAFGLVLSLVAWVAYSLLAPLALGATDNLPLVFAVEFLAGVTVKGISSLPLALLPLGNLDGGKLLKWRRLVWAGAYAIGLAAFMLVLLTIPKAWAEVPGDFGRWLLLFGSYALAAVVIWIVNAVLIKRRPPKETPIGEQPDAITID